MSLHLSGIADTVSTGAAAGALAGSAVATVKSISATIAASAVLVESNFRHAVLHSIRKKLVRAVASTGATVSGASAAISVATSVAASTSSTGCVVSETAAVLDAAPLDVSVPVTDVMSTSGQFFWGPNLNRSNFFRPPKLSQKGASTLLISNDTYYWHRFLTTVPD